MSATIRRCWTQLQCLPYIWFSTYAERHRLHQSNHPRQCLISIICKRIPVLTLKVAGYFIYLQIIVPSTFCKRIYFAAYTFQPAADQSLHLPGPDILQSQSFCYIRLRAARGYSIGLFSIPLFTGTKRYGNTLPEKSCASKKVRGHRRCSIPDRITDENRIILGNILHPPPEEAVHYLQVPV